MPALTEQQKQRKRDYYKQNKERHKEQMQAWYIKNKEQTLNKQKEFRKANKDKLSLVASEKRRNDRFTATANTLIAAARARAKIKNVPVDFDYVCVVVFREKLKFQPFCPCCNKAFDLSAGKKKPSFSSPSLDRRQPRLGYVQGNVDILCHRCNQLKSDSTLEELEIIVAWLRASLQA